MQKRPLFTCGTLKVVGVTKSSEAEREGQPDTNLNSGVSTPVKRWSISSSRTDQNVCCELSRRRQELLVHIGRAARAIGRTLEFDDDGAIDEAVEHRHSERSISQVFGPCIEINVGDEDSRTDLVSAGDNFVEKVRCLRTTLHARCGRTRTRRR